jgi:hypothetical protein
MTILSELAIFGFVSPMQLIIISAFLFLFWICKLFMATRKQSAKHRPRANPVRDNVQQDDAIAAPTQPVAPQNVVCPACGANVAHVGRGGVCEYCGTRLN